MMKKRAKWTIERRQKQTIAIEKWKPWTRSTGPKTELGKIKASKNSFKNKGFTKHEIDARREGKLTANYIMAMLSIAVSGLSLSRKGIARFKLIVRYCDYMRRKGKVIKDIPVEFQEHINSLNLNVSRMDRKELEPLMRKLMGHKLAA